MNEFHFGTYWELQEIYLKLHLDYYTMEKLSRNAKWFVFLEEFQDALNILKEKLVSALILVYPN